MKELTDLKAKNHRAAEGNNEGVWSKRGVRKRGKKKPVRKGRLLQIRKARKKAGGLRLKPG